MEHDVLEVNREVQEQHRHDNRDPNRRVKVVEESPTALFSHGGKTDRKDWKGKSKDCGVHHDKRHVVRPADHAWNFATAARGCYFPKRHGGENPEKYGEA